MKKELCLFLQDWMITACASCRSTLTLYHPEDHRVLLELEPTMEDWEVYDAQGRALGRVGKGLQGQIDARSFCLLQRDVEVQERFFYAWQAMTIGRGATCTVTLSDPYVSQMHCAILLHESELELIDADSTNGTYVNGRRMHRCLLQPGDVIAISSFRLMIGSDFLVSTRSLPLSPIEVNERLRPCRKETKALVWLQPFAEQIEAKPPLPPALPPPPSMPFLLQVGPGLTMAMCSLLASQQTNYWLQAGIMAAMVLWPFTNALYQRLHWHRSRRRIRSAYAKKLEEWQQCQHRQFIRQMQLRKEWQKQLTDTASLLRGGGPYLYLGEELRSLFVCAAQAEVEDTYCRQLYQQVLEDCCRPASMAALYRLPALVWVIGKQRVCFALFLLMQLLKQMEDAVIHVLGFSDLQIFGRLRFLRCFSSHSLLETREDAQDRMHILLCEESAYRSQLVREGDVCIVVSTDERRMDLRGLLVDLERQRCWKDGWQTLTLGGSSLAEWEAFCVFMESDACVSAPRASDFLSLYSCSSVEKLPILEQWAKRKEHTLAAVLGWEEDGERITLDAHEKGDGPHGIVAGMTGSGKSELLLTYILSLAVSYPPEQVSFFLIDYKGGAMAKAFRDLPHICGVMTNLEEASLQRVRISLAQELRLRQQLFQEQMQRHNVSSMSLEEYARCRQDSDLPLGHLFLIVDEFAQLRQEHGEFLADLQRIARIGRSLGIHLLLCTQKPAGVIDDQIWSNARFHLCLRVQDENDSREMLHRNDAAHLRKSGEFLLQVGNDERFVHGQGAYANADYCPSRFYRPNGIHHLRILDPKGKPLYHHTWQTRRSVHKQLPAICAHIRKLAGRGRIARSVCMEELEAFMAHASFCEPYQIGWIDQPQRQRIRPFTIEKRSLLVLTPSSADARRFLMNCVQAIEQAGERTWYYIGEGSAGIRTVSDQDLHELALLFYHLEREASDACILVESTGSFHARPQLFSRLCHLEVRHQLILLCEQPLYGRSPLLMTAWNRASFAWTAEGTLREWFDERELPLMRHPDSGILQEEGTFRFLCGTSLSSCTQRHNGAAKLEESYGQRSVGMDEEGMLFFWTSGQVVLLLYADPGVKKQIGRLRQRWEREGICLYSGLVEDARMQQLVQEHRYDGTLCWIGAGMEEHGYRCGFRSNSCTKEEMVVRMQGEEHRIRLWKGGKDE